MCDAVSGANSDEEAAEALVNDEEVLGGRGGLDALLAFAKYVGWWRKVH